MQTAGRWLALATISIAGGITIVGCSRKLAGAFLDLPPQPAPLLPAARTRVDTVRIVHQVDAPPVALAIEKTLNADSAIALLPRDHAGNIDWAAALRRGIIRPRAVLPGRQPLSDTSFQFKFDFYFPGSDTLFDASFPHSTHVQWLDCQQCHSRIFRYRGAPIKMADVFTGKFCGECHGKVSFNPIFACERCHTRLNLPADRAQPELLGTIVMTRAAPDSARGVVDGNAAGVNTAALPRAVFPHWVHRIRFRCKACHMEVFEPKAGANRITMKAIDQGQFCGKCHDGVTAFQPTLGTCSRCHVEKPAKPASGGDR